MLRDSAKLRLIKLGAGAPERTAEGMRFPISSGMRLQGSHQDGAIRIRTIFEPGIHPLVSVRSVSTGVYALQVQPDAKTIRLTLWDSQKLARTTLQTFTAPHPLQPGQEYELELRAVGSTLTARLDDQLLGSVEDSRLPTGEFGVDNSGGLPAVVRSIEFLDLDVPVQASSSPDSAERWQDVLHDAAKLDLGGAVDRTPEGLRFSGIGNAKILSVTGRQDAAVRARMVHGGMRLALMAHKSASRYYRLFVRNNNLVLDESELTGHSDLREVSLPSWLQTGQEYTLELRVVGQVITAKFNGEIQFTVPNITRADLRFAISNIDNGPPTVIKTLEVLDLDVPAKASPSPAPQVSASPPTEPWQDLLHDPGKANLDGGAERTPDGMLLTGDRAGVRLKGPRHDAAVRARVIFGGQRLGMIAREGRSPTSRIYDLFPRGNDQIVLALYEGPVGKPRDLRVFSLHDVLKPGEEYTSELRAVGPALTAKFNGEVLGTITDTTLTQGNFGIAAVDAAGTPTLIKSLEVLDLYAPAQASPSPAPQARSLPRLRPSRNGRMPCAISHCSLSTTVTSRRKASSSAVAAPCNSDRFQSATVRCVCAPLSVPFLRACSFVPGLVIPAKRFTPSKSRIPPRPN